MEPLGDVISAASDPTAPVEVVGVSVAVGDGVAVAVAVAVGLGVAVAVAVGDGVDVATGPVGADSLPSSVGTVTGTNPRACSPARM